MRKMKSHLKWTIFKSPHFTYGTDGCASSVFPADREMFRLENVSKKENCAFEQNQYGRASTLLMPFPAGQISAI